MTGYCRYCAEQVCDCGDFFGIELVKMVKDAIHHTWSNEGISGVEKVARIAVNRLQPYLHKRDVATLIGSIREREAYILKRWGEDKELVMRLKDELKKMRSKPPSQDNDDCEE